jgi:hypothetical protein
MLNTQRLALGAAIAVLLVLAVTNPDSNKFREQLVTALRDQFDAIATDSNEGTLLIGALVSSYAPEAIDGMVNITRNNYLLFSLFKVTPKGLLSVSLELADEKALAREGLCVIGIAGTFVPCNAHATEWLSVSAATP